MSVTYQIRLLGFVQVERNRSLVHEFVSRKAVALLGYLAMQDRPVPRSHLAALFWPDKSDGRGRANLSLVMNNLTRLLPDLFQADYHTVYFRPSTSYWLDIRAFDELCSRGNVDDLTAASKLYQSQLMNGTDLKDCPEFESWLSSEQWRWHQRMVDVLQKLITYHTHRGEIDLGLEFTGRLLGLDPWHEAAHRQMMLLLARSGQRGAALAQYETCRQIFNEHLGVEPEAETQTLYQRIRAMEMSPHHNLPGQPTRFIGRKAELAEIAERLHKTDCRLLTLVGPGGIGKTRLAVQAARRIAEAKVTAFLNGVYYVPLDSLKSPDLLATTMSSSLNLPLQGAKDHRTQLVDFLREKEMLLVLDNFEHLLAGTDLLVEILKQAPAIKLLITSRVRLNLRWEWLLEIDGLPYPDEAGKTPHILTRKHEDVETMGAVQLFLQTAQRVHPQFSFAEHQEAVMQICRLVEGMPLAIELAATGVRTCSCVIIAQEIERGIDSLATTIWDVPARHRSIQAVFDYSWHFLSATEQDVFTQLTVFRGNFQLEAARQVAEASQHLLASLVNKSFLRAIGSDRYQMHDLLRQYGDKKLRLNTEKHESVRELFCAYYVNFLKHREPHSSENQQEALVQIAAEIDNVRQAWSWAIEQGNFREIEKCLNVLLAFYELRGWFHEGLEVFRQAAENLDNLINTLNRDDQNYLLENHVLLARITVRQTWFMIRLGCFSEARQLLRQSLVILRQFEYRIQSNLAWALYLHGLIDWHFGEYSSASRQLEEALQISQKKGDSIVMMLSLTHLGLTASARGEYAIAQKWHQSALVLCRQKNDQCGVGIQSVCLGWVALFCKNYVEARSLLQYGYDLCQKNVYPFGSGLALTCLGIVMWMTGEPENGKQLCLESLKIFTKIDEQFGRILALDHLGQITWAMREYLEAQQYFLEALQTAIELGLTPLVLSAVIGIAKGLILEDKKEKAAEILSCVMNHPASTQDTKERAEQHLYNLASDLPLQEANSENSRQWAAEPKTLEAVVDELLAYRGINADKLKIQ